MWTKLPLIPPSTVFPPQPTFCHKQTRNLGNKSGGETVLGNSPALRRRPYPTNAQVCVFSSALSQRF